MNGLEQTFYIMAIIYMSITFILLIAVVVVAFVIRAKINAIHENIESKIDSVTSIVEKGSEFTTAAGSAAAKQAKKVFRKTQ